MSDVVERAQAALEGVTAGPWDVRDAFIYPLSIRCGLGGIWEQDARFIAAARALVPELVAELKDARRLSEGIEHDRDFLLRELDAKDAELTAARAEIQCLAAKLGVS